MIKHHCNEYSIYIFGYKPQEKTWNWLWLENNIIRSRIVIDIQTSLWHNLRVHPLWNVPANILSYTRLINDYTYILMNLLIKTGIVQIHFRHMIQISWDKLMLANCLDGDNNIWNLLIFFHFDCIISLDEFLLSSDYDVMNMIWQWMSYRVLLGRLYIFFNIQMLT